MLWYRTITIFNIIYQVVFYIAVQFIYKNKLWDCVPSISVFYLQTEWWSCLTWADLWVQIYAGFWIETAVGGFRIQSSSYINWTAHYACNCLKSFFEVALLRPLLFTTGHVLPFSTSWFCSRMVLNEFKSNDKVGNISFLLVLHNSPHRFSSNGTSLHPCLALIPPASPKGLPPSPVPAVARGGPAYTGAAGEKSPPSDKEERAGQRRRGTWVCSTTPRYELCGACSILHCSQEKFWSTTLHPLLNQTMWTCVRWLLLMWSKLLPRGWFQPKRVTRRLLCPCAPALLLESSELGASPWCWTTDAALCLSLRGSRRWQCWGGHRGEWGIPSEWPEAG